MFTLILHQVAPLLLYFTCCIRNNNNSIEIPLIILWRRSPQKRHSLRSDQTSVSFSEDDVSVNISDHNMPPAATSTENSRYNSPVRHSQFAGRSLSPDRRQHQKQVTATTDHVTSSDRRKMSPLPVSTPIKNNGDRLAIDNKVRWDVISTVVTYKDFRLYQFILLVSQR